MRWAGQAARVSSCSASERQRVHGQAARPCSKGPHHPASCVARRMAGNRAAHGRHNEQRTSTVDSGIEHRNWATSSACSAVEKCASSSGSSCSSSLRRCLRSVVVISSTYRQGAERCRQQSAATSGAAPTEQRSRQHCGVQQASHPGRLQIRQEPQAGQRAHLARQQAQAGQLLAPLGCRQRARQQLEQLLKQMLLQGRGQACAAA